MYYEVNLKFNEYLKKNIKNKDIFQVANTHESKTKAIELTCDELIKAGNRFDLRYHERYNKIVEAAVSLWLRKLLSTLAWNNTSEAERSKVLKDEYQDKKLNDF